MSIVSAAAPRSFSAQERARLSGGTSCDPVYQCVASALCGRHPGGGRLLDVGCGAALLWPHVQAVFAEYVGADLIRHEGFPGAGQFCPVNLDTGTIPVPDTFADVVAAVETIEHVENPRALFRELTRLVRPGGWLIVTTPNQLSLLSKLTLVCKNQFNAFQDGCYPAHITALVEIDLRRMAAECGLTEIAIRYTECGRMPGTPWHYPRWLSWLAPRAFSDNVLLVGRKSLAGKDS